MTRAEPQARAFLAACEASLNRKLRCVISPVTRIVPTGDLPDFDAWNTVIVTSQNAVRLAGTKLSGRHVVTVGQQTAILAKSLGADAHCLGQTVEEFLQNVAELNAPAVHIRGVHTRGDLAQHATKTGVQVDEHVVYDQFAQELSADGKAALMRNSVVPIFSPRSAKLLSVYPSHSDLIVLAISQTTAKVWTGSGRVRVAGAPDSTSMVALVREAF